MAKVQMSLACGNYDHTRALRDGRVKPEGIELVYLSLRPPQLFPRMLEHRAFEAAELPLSSFLRSCQQEERPFVGIPVFPARGFRHSMIYVREDAEIHRPEDLRGKLVGIQEPADTAGVWMRGILQHEHGVKPEDIRWAVEPEGRGGPPRRNHGYQGNHGNHGRGNHEAVPPDKSVVELLIAGELDAVMTTRPVLPLVRGRARIRRLFPNYKEAEKAYFRKTGLLPVMHLIVLRADVYARYPWAASSLFDAFHDAKRLATDTMFREGTAPVALHWFFAELEEERALFGDDLNPYGLEPNRQALETLVDYACEQHIIDRPLPVDSLFAPETLVRVV